MNTTSSDPRGLGEPPQPRTTYSTCMLLHNVLKILAADEYKIVITGENAGQAVKRAKALLRAFGIEPDMGEP
jgi:hypothetical protein